MKKTFKKLLAGFLTLAMVLTLIPNAGVTALAATTLTRFTPNGKIQMIGDIGTTVKIRNNYDGTISVYDLPSIDTSKCRTNDWRWFLYWSSSAALTQPSYVTPLGSGTTYTITSWGKNAEWLANGSASSMTSATYDLRNKSVKDKTKKYLWVGLVNHQKSGNDKTAKDYQYARTAKTYEIPVRVTYDVNGGNTYRTDRNRNYNYEWLQSTDTLCQRIPTKSGLIFDGWYTAPTGGTKITSAAAALANMGITSDQKLGVTLYAHWITHTHSWSYAANGNTITAKCTGAGDCQYKSSGKTLTLTANGGSYNGSSYTASHNDSSVGLHSVTGASITIDYYQGSTKLSGAPVNAGTYTAKMTVGGAVASKEFTISKIAYTGSKAASTELPASKAGNTVELKLPAIPAGAVYGTPVNVPAEYITVGTVSNNKITITTAKQWSFDTGNQSFTIPVVNAANYTDYSVTVTLLPTFPHDYVISQLSMDFVTDDAEKAITTGLSVTLPENTYYKEYMSDNQEEDKDYVTTYRHKDGVNGIDIDLYVWKNDGDNLRGVAQGETDQDITYQLINNIPVAYYIDTDTDEDGTKYHTLTAIFEAGDQYSELVFWLNKSSEAIDDSMVASAMDIVSSVATSIPENKKQITPLVMGDLTLDATGQNYVSAYDDNYDEDNHQIGYYYSFDKDVDFDAYMWDNDGLNFRETVFEESDDATFFLNAQGVPTAVYYDVETVVEEGVEVSYHTMTALFYDGDKYAELVFWLNESDGENAPDSNLEEIAMNLVNAVTPARASQFETTFEMGCLSLRVDGMRYLESYDMAMADPDNEFHDENQIGYYYSFDNNVDFDLYQWTEEDADRDLKAVIQAELAEEYDEEEMPEYVLEQINGIDVAWYDAEDEYIIVKDPEDQEEDGDETDDFIASSQTRTYLMKSGKTFYEFVFYMDGEDAEEVVATIMNTLAVDHDFSGEPVWNWLPEDTDDWTEATATYQQYCSVCGELSEETSALMDTVITPAVTTRIAKTVDGTYSDSKVMDNYYAVNYQNMTASFKYGQAVTVSANTKDTVTSYNWYDITDGTRRLVATGNQYCFAIIRDVSIVSEKAEEVKPVISILKGDRVNTDSTGKQSVKLTAQWSVPSGYSFVGAGIKRAYTVAGDPVLTAVEQLTTTNATTLTNANGSFGYTINMSAATAQKTVNAVAYLTYKDADGVLKTIYSDMVYSAH